MSLDRASAAAALDRAVGQPLGVDSGEAAAGVIEMVDETMANAARIHAIESGKSFDGRTVIAFGGGGPVHACRVAEKIGADRIIVPPGAGVGSAIGFLRAPVGYEVVRSQYARLGRFDGPAADGLLVAMEADAAAVVEPGRFDVPTRTMRTAFMRYVGQGHEIPVRLSDGALDSGALRVAFDAEYARFYDRPVPGSDVEVMSYAVLVSTETAVPADPAPPTRAPEPPRSQPVRDPVSGEVTAWPVYDRAAMPPGTTVQGPAIIAEDETSTLVGAVWTAAIDDHGLIVLTRTHGA